MSAGRITRFRAVGPTEGGGSPDTIPMEILHFATIPEDRRTLLIQVSDLLDQIDYGTVVIVMHEGNLTQGRDAEKIRLSRGLPGDDRPRSS